MGNEINEHHLYKWEMYAHISMKIIYKWEIGICSIAMIEIPGR